MTDVLVAVIIKRTRTLRAQTSLAKAAPYLHIAWIPDLEVSVVIQISPKI